MTFDEIETLIKQIEEMLAALAVITEDEKGGQGSGCHGDNCGRPSEDRTVSGRVTDDNDDGPIEVGGSNEIKPTQEKPRSGVRPSSVNPNRTEIVYTEEPSSDGRPRSGVRPQKPKK